MLVPATRIQMVTCTYHLSPEHHHKKKSGYIFLPTSTVFPVKKLHCTRVLLFPETRIYGTIIRIRYYYYYYFPKLRTHGREEGSSLIEYKSIYASIYEYILQLQYICLFSRVQSTPAYIQLYYTRCSPPPTPLIIYSGLNII